MPIGAGIAAAKAAIEVSRALMDLVNRPVLPKDDVRTRVQELLIHLVNTQTALSEAQIETMELRQALDKQNERKEIQADMEFRQDGGFYVRKSESANTFYCPEPRWTPKSGH